MKSILKRMSDNDKPSLDLENINSRKNSCILSQTTKISTQRNKLDDPLKGKLFLSPKIRPLKSRKQSLILTKLYSKIRDVSATNSPSVFKHAFEFGEEKTKAAQNFNLLEKSEQTMSRIRRMNRNKDTTAKLLRAEVFNSTQRLVESRGNKDWTNTLQLKLKTIQNSSLDNIKSNNSHASPHKKHKHFHTRKLSLEEKLNQYNESTNSSNMRKSSIFNWSDIKDPIQIKIYDENGKLETQEVKNIDQRPRTNSSYNRKMMSNRVNSAISEISYADSTEYLGTAGNSLLLKIISDEKRSIPTTAREKKSLGKIILRNKQIINRLSEEDRWKDEQINFVSAKVYNIHNHASKLIESYFPRNKDIDN